MDIIDTINKLKKDKNAIILAHYYQLPEVQEIADFVGDSYYLSKKAFESQNNLVVFCGVRFMAESAKILSPDKKVLLPVMEAGCPMADMITSNDICDLKQLYPDAAVVCYINSTIAVKAVSDVCVTSSNALKIIKKLPNEKIIFVPDQNLANYISKKVPEKHFIIFNGYCPVHHKILPEHVIEMKSAYPGAVVLAHPECRAEILDLSDFTGSTGEILQYAKQSEHSDFIVITEEGIAHELTKQNPSKNFWFPQDIMCCEDMKKTTLENILSTLDEESGEIILDERERLAALNCLTRMHELS